MKNNFVNAVLSIENGPEAEREREALVEVSADLENQQCEAASVETSAGEAASVETSAGEAASVETSAGEAACDDAAGMAAVPHQLEEAPSQQASFDSPPALSQEQELLGLSKEEILLCSFFQNVNQMRVFRKMVAESENTKAVARACHFVIHSGFLSETTVRSQEFFEAFVVFYQYQEEHRMTVCNLRKHLGHIMAECPKYRKAHPGKFDEEGHLIRNRKKS